MRMLSRTGCAASIAAVWVACGTPQPPEPAAKRPNILVLVSDDHRADALGVAGHPFVTTPALDRLANEGVRFREAFSTHGVCAPARAALLTGKTAAANGVTCIRLDPWNTFDRQETPFPVQLHDAGYTTVHAGKWHLGRNDRPHTGYDRWLGTIRLLYYDTPWVLDGDPVTGGLYDDHADLTIARFVAAEIERLAGQETPFAIYAAFKAPHQPFEPSAARANDLADVTIPRPASFDAETGLGVGTAPEVEGRVGAAAFDGSWQDFVKAYYRTIHTLDDAVGTILDALDRAGVADDTLVVYTSDQGLALGERGTTGKQFAHEQTMRVPLLLRFPGRIPAGETRDAMALITDVAPTVLDYSGATPSIDMTGRSLRPVIDGSETSWREDLLFEYWYFGNRGRRPAHLALRTDRHKLVRFTDSDVEALYDLEADPEELTNRIADPQAHDLARDLRGRMAERIAAQGWARRDQVTVRRLYAAGPFESARDAFEAAARAGTPETGSPVGLGNEASWQRLAADRRGHFDLDSFAPGVILLALVLERDSPRDPAVLLRFGRESAPFEARASAGGDPFTLVAPAGRRNWRERSYNPPLDPGTNVVWLAVDRRRAPGGIRLAMVSPTGSVRLTGPDRPPVSPSGSAPGS